MAVVTRAAAKAYFETGDKPTQAQFIDTLDSTLFQEDVSTLGKALGSAASTAAAQNLLGIPGISVPGTVGNIILGATTTASAVNQLGLGSTPTTAAQSDQETGTTGSKFVSPSVQQFHQSASKAWVDFNGTGTISIYSSYNVTGITDNGVGDYTVNFTTSFSSSAAYCGIAGAGEGVASATDLDVRGPAGADPTAAAWRFKVLDGSQIVTNKDAQFCNAQFFGDQA